LAYLQQVGPTLTSAGLNAQQRQDFDTALDSGLTPPQRTQEATAQSASIDAAMKSMQFDFMKGLKSGDQSALFGQIHDALGGNPQLEASTVAGMKSAIAMGPKGWDTAQTILTNALKANNTAQTAGAESAARATAVPGSEAETVQRMR